MAISAQTLERTALSEWEARRLAMVVVVAIPANLAVLAQRAMRGRMA